MKKVWKTLTVLLICLSLVCSVCAAGFVDSITYKDHPEVVETEDGDLAVLYDEDGNVIGYLNEDCIVIKSVGDQDAPQTLLDIYDALKNGTVEIPYGDDTDWVVRDLFDVSLICDDHPEMLEEGGQLVITLDLGVSADTKVNAMVYTNGEWRSAVSMVNNGDGTVTITLDVVGVIAISVPASEYVTAPNTGDEAGSSVMVWGVVMVIAVVALVILVVKRRKIVR